MRGCLQVTSEPTLAPLLSELIHSEQGQEVRLRQPADYHIHDLKKTSFAEVAEYARTKDETAIGYVAHQYLLAHQHLLLKHGADALIPACCLVPPLHRTNQLAMSSVS